MRLRTGVTLLVVVGALAAVAIVGVGPSTASGELTERWVSDTPRDNQRNHHAVGVGPDDDVVIASVTAIPRPNVTLSDDACELVRLSPADGSVSWRSGVPGEACFSHALTEPTVADVDRDGDLEVVVATTEEALVVSDAATGREEWRVPLRTYGYGRPTVANLTPAPGPEVVVADIGGNLAVVDGNGTVRWRATLAATGRQRPTVWAAPVVADVDGEDGPEVLLGGLNGPALFDADGRLLWQQDGDATYLATGHVDSDHSLEAFTGGEAVAAIDGATGEVEWRQSLPGPRLRTVADVDSDGAAELLVGTSDGRVLALNASTGTTDWESTVSGTNDVVAPPVIADLDGDGSPAVVAAMRSGTVVVLDGPTGNELTAYERAVPVWTVPTPSDLDGDGRSEILVRYGDGRVVALAFDPN
jgi:outer membrane protein assembly factor BamB